MSVGCRIVADGRGHWRTETVFLFQHFALYISNVTFNTAPEMSLLLHKAILPVNQRPIEFHFYSLDMSDNGYIQGGPTGWDFCFVSAGLGLR